MRFGCPQFTIHINIRISHRLASAQIGYINALSIQFWRDLTPSQLGEVIL